MANRPIPVALCITDLDVGGAERNLVALARGLNRLLFAPEVYCLGPPPAGSTAALATQLREAGVPVHYLAARHAWHFPRVVRRMRRMFRGQRPAVMQSFLFHANFTARIAARRLGARVV
jgi:hypothetical protein